MSVDWTTCSDCHRVLYAQDGPTCPDCLARGDHEPTTTQQLAGEGAGFAHPELTATGDQVSAEPQPDPTATGDVIQLHGIDGLSESVDA